MKQKVLRPKKRFGQNFLIDQDILKQIIDSAELSPADTVLEIGMGTGILTEALAKKAGRVITVEIDRDLFALTKTKLAQYKNVDFILGDFLQQAETVFAGVTGRLKVIANIPYYITTPILEKLFEYTAKVKTITLMIQKEVAERILAVPSTKAYGSLSLFVQYYAESRAVCQAPASAFTPSPKVDSVVLRLDVYAQPKYHVLTEKRLFNLIRGAFWGRRKTLRNTLKKSPYTHYTEAMLTKLSETTGIDLMRRGETLSLEEYVKLANVKF